MDGEQHWAAAREPVRVDVAVQGERIVDVGRFEQAEAKTVLDAGGCVVTPGFVDMHSHTDFTLPALPTADSLVQQGITTAVVGQCGASPAPLLWMRLITSALASSMVILSRKRELIIRPGPT